MVPIEQLAIKRSARNEFLRGRYRLAVVGADRLPGHKFRQMVEVLDDLPPELVRDGPVSSLFLGVDLGQGTYGETIEASVAIGLTACRGVGNRPHAISRLTLFQATVVHEIGHTVAFGEDRRLQKEFNRVFWPGDERDRARGNVVTSYALLTPVEDFAEAFLYYRYHGARMDQACPLRYAWMRDRVFGGQEFA